MSLSPELAAELVLIKQGINDANATRYLAISGTVVLAYDHLLTLNDESRLWRAESSLSKWLFLFNRYFVLVMLIVIAHEMCGFGDNVYSDTGCKYFLSATSMLGVLSTAVANLLALFRVLMLWHENTKVRVTLWTAYSLSVSLIFTFMIITCVKLWKSVSWSPIVQMCILEDKTPFFTALWGTPIFFEVIVLSSVIYSTISSPRSAHLPLRNALQRDGLAFFLTVTTLRLFNAIIAGVSRPGLTTLGVYFVWGMITAVLNRSLLRMRNAEAIQLRSRSPGFGRTAPPFKFPSEMEMREGNGKYSL